MAIRLADYSPEVKANGRIARPEISYFFTFFGSQSFFLVAETKPHSLQRKSPGLALRIGFPFWQLTATPRPAMVSVPHSTISKARPRGNRRGVCVVGCRGKVSGRFSPCVPNDIF